MSFVNRIITTKNSVKRVFTIAFNKKMFWLTYLYLNQFFISKHFYLFWTCYPDEYKNVRLNIYTPISASI
ncbi:hypothetical protein SAMN04488023_1163 [Pedobacter rhizosphaerae]|uniref:Uncharacterized protein n=1 Tax=Pedobacter rhizosphaerae TaxID=390241 RepID=A0A1H9RYN4_9SPHI|nr:hypothetical protein SAMN04488023_1163 [Pedobacter rhizosphaerae]